MLEARSRTDPELVSVLIPAHNAAATIGDQLCALGRQTYRGNVEIVVVDNLSTDDTASEVGRWITGDHRIRLVRATERPGVSHARNVGLRQARGDLICVCDADDVAEEAWIETLVATARGADVVGGALTDHPESMRQQRWRTRRHFTNAPSGLGFLPYAHGCNVAVWRDVAMAVDGWDEDLVGGGDDVDFSWRAQLAGYRFAFEPDAKVMYRQRPSLRALAVQMYRYGMQWPALLLRFQSAGARRRPWRTVTRTYLWLLTRSPYLLTGDTWRRGRWISELALAAGRFMGSVRYRIVCL